MVTIQFDATTDGGRLWLHHRTALALWYVTFATAELFESATCYDQLNVAPASSHYPDVFSLGKRYALALAIWAASQGARGHLP